MATNKNAKHIAVLCDGSWCGPETNTRSNIQILADALASHDNGSGVTLVTERNPTSSNQQYNPTTKTVIGYFNGVGTAGIEGAPQGLMSGFADMLVYCINGALAGDLPLRCKEAYTFIAEQYNGPSAPGQPAGNRVLMFGLSRGAYTVRAVAGMINNCGILKRTVDGEDGNKHVDATLVDRVWEMYISNTNTPHDKDAEEFKKENSWPPADLPPVEFMGLIDTVGAIGLPRVDSTAAKDPFSYIYNPFRDYVVSGEVQHVFQACCTHDRLAPFELCFVRRNNKSAHAYKVDYSTVEVFYPGAHYDVGRQDFVFSNQPITAAINRWTNITGTNVNCTPELGDYPVVGMDLNNPQDALLAKDASPCIVAALCAVNSNLLPPPTDTDTWRKYVAGPPPPEDWALLRSMMSVAWWGFNTFTRPVLGFVVGGLTGTAMFQEPLTIDAETKLLSRLSKVLSLGLGFQKDIVLRDRVIPLPGYDKAGAEIKPAVFFKVPTDEKKYGSPYASQKANGRTNQEWFISRTYDEYVEAARLHAPEPAADASAFLTTRSREAVKTASGVATE